MTDPIPTAERADYDPGPCPNCGQDTVRVVSWLTPAGMEEGLAIPTGLTCSSCEWDSSHVEPEEVPIP